MNRDKLEQAAEQVFDAFNLLYGPCSMIDKIEQEQDEPSVNVVTGADTLTTIRDRLSEALALMNEAGVATPIL